MSRLREEPTTAMSRLREEPTTPMTHELYDVVIVGDACGRRVGAKLLASGTTNVVAVAGTPISSEFDEATHTWELRSRNGDSHRARIVISGTPPPRDDGMQPYLGVAVHGWPNYFISGDNAEARVQYILDCLKVMARTGSTRIEVRYSTQRVFNDRMASKREGSNAIRWRRMRNKISSAFDLSSPVSVEDVAYDGPATIGIGNDEHAVRARLTGHLEPVDGRYHWQGTVWPEHALPQNQPVTVTVGDRTAQARITERTPWGSYSVAGVGAPPFKLEDVEIAVPRL
jgi:hypothetical protein